MRSDLIFEITPIDVNLIQNIVFVLIYFIINYSNVFSINHATKISHSQN